MPDAFAYCADLVRATDRDRFIATLFAPADRRGALHALYAFNSEIARVHEAVREALPGEVRLQWWRDVIGGERKEARANPVASALLETMARHGLAAERLVALIEARRFDLYDDPMATLIDLETYARDTSSALLGLAARILSGSDAEAFTGPAGIAYAMAGLIRAFPLHAVRRRLYVPVELLERHRAHPHDIFAGRPSAGLAAALAELRDVARHHLDAAREHATALPPTAIAAVLPVALVRPSLDRSARSDPFAPGEIAPWRKQWLIWRAARNPARIAG